MLSFLYFEYISSVAALTNISEVNIPSSKTRKGWWFQGQILILKIWFCIKFLSKTDSVVLLRNILSPIKRKVSVFF